MLTVNLLAENTDLESVKEQFHQNVSSPDLERSQRLFNIAIPVDEEEARLSNEQQDYVKRMKEEMDWFFHEDIGAVEQANDMRLYFLSNQKVATEARTMIAYIVEMEDNVSIGEAREAKERLTEIDSDMEIDFTMPSP